VAINERGQVIGYRETPTGMSAFLWQNGTTTALGTLGGAWSFPTAISNRGQVVGYSTDRSGVQHAFVWQNGTMTGLPSPTGSTRTRAIAINEHNQIIGDNCYADCGNRSGPLSGSKFGVLWTLHRVARNGRWIAYSTAAAGDRKRYYGASGSDVFMTRVGGRPRLVAGRDRGEIWNVCPAFSPNGRMLAFGRRAPRGSTIVVIGVTRDGTTGAPKVLLKVPGPWAPDRCPRWSSDSSRLAYLDGSRTIVVRGLDGSRRHRVNVDPRIRDFDRNKSVLLSPPGDLIARRGTAGSFTIAVSRPNLSDRRVIKDDPPSYAIAGWSPDGGKLVLMRDVGGGFTMRAVSVEAPFASTTVVGYVPVNNARSWPGQGDVSSVAGLLLISGAGGATSLQRFFGSMYYAGPGVNPAGHDELNRFVARSKVGIVFLDEDGANTPYRFCWRKRGGQLARCWKRQTGKVPETRSIIAAHAPRRLGRYVGTWYVRERPVARWRFRVVAARR
jgi:probable HAF family extracellular repeat protein